MRKVLAGSLAIALLFSAGPRAAAEARVKVIVPLAPGGAMDFVARLLAEQIGSTRGTTIVVESRPGAGTEIGTEVVSRAAPDGRTLLINAGGNLLIGPQLPQQSYDPLISFEPICELVSVPDMIVVNSRSSYRSLVDLVDAARRDPGHLTVASLGPNTDTQIQFEKLKRATNVNMTFVPYSGVAPAINAVLGEHVTAAITSYATGVEQIRAGRLRALAATTPTRIEALPDVATVAESGYREYDAVDTWFGLFAPANIPREKTTQLAGWFAAALRAPEVRAKLVAQGLYPAANCGPDFAALVRKQYEDFGRVIREANMKAE